jgi:hypothetical protein
VRVLRLNFQMILLMTTALMFCLPSSSSCARATPFESPDPCSLSTLPSEIQQRLKEDFGSWKVQASENLSERARQTWDGKKPSGCPGIAVGLFQNVNTLSYALLLVPVDHPNSGYRFVVFSRNAGQPSYAATVVEKLDGHGAANYFVRKVPVKEFFSEESKKKFQAQATEAILMVDSAEQEYGTEIYFWSNGRYRHEPADD